VIKYGLADVRHWGIYGYARRTVRDGVPYWGRGGTRRRSAPVCIIPEGEEVIQTGRDAAGGRRIAKAPVCITRGDDTHRHGRPQEPSDCLEHPSVSNLAAARGANL